MSDTEEELRQAAAAAFDATSPERVELAEGLRKEMKSRPFEGMQYVAQPAPGYDLAGLWHCFGTEYRSGYAMHAIALHWVVANSLGIRMQLTPHITADIDIERFPADRDKLLFAWTKETVGIPRALICSYPPETAMQMAGKAPKLVPYVAFEGTKISDFGKRLCERDVFDSVWVVSESVRSAYLAAGVAPERVKALRPMLCGGPWPMPPIERLHETRNRPVTHDDPFVFATVGTWHKRKGMHDLVRAYFTEFRREEPVLLVIRTSGFGDRTTIRELREKIIAEIALVATEFGDVDFPASHKMPRIRFEFGTKLTDVELIGWISQVDCYVNPSYGEGMGIPQTWAKACGVPIVSTGFGAIGDLLREVASGMDHVVDYTLARVDPVMCRLGLMYAIDTQWGVYVPEVFGAGMRAVAERGRVTDRTGAMVVRERFGEKAAATALRGALVELLGESAITELIEMTPAQAT